MTDAKIAREGFWIRYLAGESLAPEESASLLNELKDDPTFLHDCANEMRIMTTLAEVHPGPPDVATSPPSSFYGQAATGDAEIAYGAGSNVRKQVNRLVTDNSVIVEVVREGDGEYHIYLAAPRPEWKDKTFTLRVAGLTESGVWSDAGPEEVSAELFPSDEVGAALALAGQGGVQVEPDE